MLVCRRPDLCLPSINILAQSRRCPLSRISYILTVSPTVTLTMTPTRRHWCALCNMSLAACLSTVCMKFIQQRIRHLCAFDGMRVTCAIGTCGCPIASASGLLRRCFMVHIRREACCDGLARSSNIIGDKAELQVDIALFTLPSNAAAAFHISDASAPIGGYDLTWSR